MRKLDVPADFTLDLGYRKVRIAAGVRTYPDEIASSPRMARYAVPDAPAPGVPQAPEAPKAALSAEPAQ